MAQRARELTLENDFLEGALSKAGADAVAASGIRKMSSTFR
jgi:hypothetical protein